MCPSALAQLHQTSVWRVLARYRQRQSSLMYDPTYFSMIDTDFCIMAYMKTTLDLRDDLLVRAKETAVREGTSLTRMIEEGLAVRLRRPRAVRGKLKPLPISARNGGLRTGIDGKSNRSLFDAADA